MELENQKNPEEQRMDKEQNHKIAIIEDEVDLLEVMTTQLKSEGFEVSGFTTFEEYMERVDAVQPDVIITDNRLPGKSGFDLISEVRRQDKDIPILMITGQPSSVGGIKALNEGADDYLSKPIEMDFLVAKIQRLIERRGQKGKTVDGFRLDRKTGELFYEDRTVKFTDTEFEIFSHLFNNVGELVERDNLERHTSQQRSLDVHMHSIRKKIEGLPIEIQTLKHKGYRLKLIKKDH